jgi:hypothetical protein
MKAVPSRFLRGFAICTSGLYLWYLLFKSNLLFMLWFHFSQVMVLPWWWCPLWILWWRCCPLELLLFLPASVSLSSTCWIHYGLLPLPSSNGNSLTTPHPSKGWACHEICMFFLAREDVIRHARPAHPNDYGSSPVWLSARPTCASTQPPLALWGALIFLLIFATLCTMREFLIWHYLKI